MIRMCRPTCHEGGLSSPILSFLCFSNGKSMRVIYARVNGKDTGHKDENIYYDKENTCMADVIEATTQTQPAPSIAPSQGEGKPRPYIARLRALALGGVMLISIFMNFYQLGQNGFGNLYYAAGVRSMLNNWHNFFFVSYDPGGFVTIDKPPLGFWLQVVSAKLFGFTPFSIFLPQALAGVLSVLLLYHLVRRHFGVVAGLLTAFALAISPISVLNNRNNTINSTLVIDMLLGDWAVLRAAETGKLRCVLLCGVFVGLGFN